MKLSCSSSSCYYYFFETVHETQSLSIQMKAAEQYFPMVLFFMLSRWSQFLILLMKFPSVSVAISKKVINQYFFVLLFWLPGKAWGLRD